MCKLFVLITHSTSSKGEQSKRLLSSITTWVVAKGQKNRRENNCCPPPFLFVPCSMWDLSSPTRDWTPGPCNGSTKYQPLEHRGSPRDPFSLSSLYLCLFPSGAMVMENWSHFSVLSQEYPRISLTESQYSGLRGHWGLQQTVTVSDMWINANEP